MTRIPLDMTPEVADARSENKPVLALESTIISHGMPYPKNVETALSVEKIAREEGVVPATIAILDGKLKVGMSPDDIDRLGREGTSMPKASRRDLSVLLASAMNGATTVAATMIIAELAGIRVFATGGIGGVHRGAEKTFDISADLEELARTEVAVVCAGFKSILDIPLTMEYLETKGVPVLGYRCSELPAFYTETSGIPIPNRVETSEEIAEIMNIQWNMGLNSGLVIAQPVPKDYSMDKNTIDEIIKSAVQEAENKGITGKDVTPFLLARIVEITGGESLETNIALVENNVRLGSKIAREYAVL